MANNETIRTKDYLFCKKCRLFYDPPEGALEYKMKYGLICPEGHAVTIDYADKTIPPREILDGKDKE